MHSNHSKSLFSFKEASYSSSLRKTSQNKTPESVETNAMSEEEEKMA